MKTTDILISAQASGSEEDGPSWIPRPGVMVPLMFLLVVLLQAVMALRVPEPMVVVHDEAAYMLGADTLLQGRFTNPSPPSPKHFEMLHVLVEPSYAMKYPIGQAVFLAIGKLLFGSAHCGVVLSVAMAAAAAAWAGAGWAGRGGALVAGLFCALNYGSGGSWVRSYWGGGVALLGAFLVLGAYPRLRLYWRLHSVLMLGLGLGLLFFSRPYEGGVLGMTIIAFLAPAAWKALRSDPSATAQALGLLIAIGVGVVGMQLFINREVTGSWKTLPYQAHYRLNNSAPLFWFLPATNAPQAVSPETEALYAADMANYRAKNSMPFWKALFEFGPDGRVFAWPRFLPLLLMAWRPVRQAYRFPAGFTILMVAAFLTWFAVAIETNRFEHYLAPFAACLSLLLGCAWSAAVSTPRLGRQLGLVVALVLAFESRNSLKRYVYLMMHPDAVSVPESLRLKERLEREPGKHLVFVRWNGPIDPHSQWIANTVPIDRQRSIWVWDLGAERNIQVIEAYPGRRRWLCVPDATHVPGPSLLPMAGE